MGGTFKVPVFLINDKTLIFSSPAVATVTFKTQSTAPVATPNGFDFVDGGGGNDSIVRNDGGSWLAEGYQVGKSVAVTNATNAANNGTYAILVATASTLEVATASLTADTDDNTARFSHHIGAVQVGLSLKEIVSQIDAATTNIAVRATVAANGQARLSMVHTASTPSAVTLTTGTANTLLGFYDNQTGAVYNPPTGVAPRWLSVVHPTATDGAFYVAAEE